MSVTKQADKKVKNESPKKEKEIIAMYELSRTRGFKRKVVFFITVVSVLIVLVLLLWQVGFWSELFKSGEKDLDLVVGGIFSIMSTLIAIGSLLTGVSSTHSAMLGNVREYYEKIESPEIYHARHLLYNYRAFKNEENDIASECIGQGISLLEHKDFDRRFKNKYKLPEQSAYDNDSNGVREASYHMANFYQMWGFLQDRGFLPMWVFETSAGFNLIRLYYSIQDVVIEKRKNNMFYADEFEGLCKRVCSRYYYKLRKCYKSCLSKVSVDEKEFVSKWLGDLDKNITIGEKILSITKNKSNANDSENDKKISLANDADKIIDKTKKRKNGKRKK